MNLKDTPQFHSSVSCFSQQKYQQPKSMRWVYNNNRPFNEGSYEISTSFLDQFLLKTFKKVQHSVATSAQTRINL